MRLCQLVFQMALFGAATTLAAQSSARFSGGAAGIGVSLGGDELEGWETGFGGELQARFGVRGWSVGVGFQTASLPLRSFQTNITQRGVFVEPRLTLNARGGRVSPYVAGRVSLLSHRLLFGLPTGRLRYTASGTMANGGGGVLLGVGRRAAIDLGVQFGRFHLHDGESVTEPGGTSLGEVMGGKGTNTIVRLGIQLGARP